jgi:hypothetical protein
MKAGRTAGEWKRSRSGADYEIWAPGTPKIAMVLLTNASINELEANSALIVAAPKMEDALRKIAGLSTSHVVWTDGKGTHSDLCTVCIAQKTLAELGG